MRDGCISINSLHPELLVQIFSLVLDDGIPAPNVNVFEPFALDPDDLGSPSRRAQLKKVVAISSVCLYWRRVTLNNGAFWTYIPINFTSESIQRSLGTMSVCLDRASTAPLDVFIHAPNPVATHSLVNSPNISENALNDALLEAPFGGKQVRTLWLRTRKPMHFNALLERWFGSTVPDTLTKLRISVYDGFDHSLAFQNWLSRCQELQLLRTNVSPLCDDHFPLLPKLVDLELTMFLYPMTTLQLANLLRGCPNLRQLTLDCMDIISATSVDAIPAPLQHLGVLNLMNLDDTEVLPIISSKSDSLSITITALALNDPGRDLVDYIDRLSRLSIITALQLNVGDIKTRDIRRLFNSLPHLQTLSLKDVYLDSSMALALRGVDGFEADNNSTVSTSPTPCAIWLVQSEIDDEEVLRLLVSVRPLQQLKLDGCFLETSGSILEAEELHKFLLDSVPDLTICE